MCIFTCRATETLLFCIVWASGLFGCSLFTQDPRRLDKSTLNWWSLPSAYSNFHGTVRLSPYFWSIQNANWLLIMLWISCVFFVCCCWNKYKIGIKCYYFRIEIVRFHWNGCIDPRTIYLACHSLIWNGCAVWNNKHQPSIQNGSSGNK